MNELYDKIEKMYGSCKYTIREVLNAMRELGYKDEDIERELKKVCNKLVPPTKEYI